MDKKTNRLEVSTIYSPEFINLESSDISPLMSKCEVKVLYVGENRNGSVISKEVACNMAKTLRGAPIVGYFIDKKEDFGDHGDQVIIDAEGIKFKKLTKPYGFVSPDAKIWFQCFEEVDSYGITHLREYLMTEGFLWTTQYEECKRVIERGNNQSMELDESTLKGYWSEDVNKGVEFFIINDAIFSKLCILGEDVEPCFEGASIYSNSEFRNNSEFTKSLFTMMNELNFALKNSKGGKTMDKEQENIVTNFSESDGQVSAEGPVAEGAETTPADNSISLSSVQPEGPQPVEGTQLNATDVAVLTDLDESYAPVGEDVDQALVRDGATNIEKKVEGNFVSKKDKKEESEEEKTDDSMNEEESKDKKKKDMTEAACGGGGGSSTSSKPKKKEYSAEEYEKLESEYALLKTEYEKLLDFKQQVEDKEKDELIASFYMLSDEDKKDIVQNKKNYSLREIKAELSILCVDKKVDFNLNNKEENLMYNVNSQTVSDMPAWLQAVEDTKNRNNQ